MSAVAEAGLRHVSPSSLNRFIRCPESFRQRYCLGKKDPAGAKALVGSADSKAYADFYTARIGGGPGLAFADVQDSFRDHLIDQADRDDFNLEDENTSSLIDGAMPLLAAYYEVAKKMPDPVAVEQKVLIERDSLPIPILGYIDVEFGQAGIDRKIAANKSVHPDWRIQNRIYSAAQGKPWGWHITTRTKVPAVWTPTDGDGYEEPWSQARADKTIRMVGQIIGQIESCLLMFGADDPWPTTGLSHTWACGTCAYRKECPAWT